MDKVKNHKTPRAIKTIKAYRSLWVGFGDGLAVTSFMIDDWMPHSERYEVTVGEAWAKTGIAMQTALDAHRGQETPKPTRSTSSTSTKTSKPSRTRAAA